MKKHKIIGITLFSLTILILLSSCPELFKDVETIYIDNKSDYTIDFFIDDEYETTIAPGIKYKTANYTNVTHTLLCTSGAIQWGPESIKLTKGEPYTWTINNPPEPTPTPEPTPIPQADITINNNSSWTVAISIAGESENTIDPGFSDTYTKDIGNYNLVALPQGANGNWQININLTEDGYIWNIEMNIELYPAENCRVWNFENNYEDHLGIDDWDVKSKIAYSAVYNKFGNYGLSALDKSQGRLEKENYWIVGSSISYGAWINFAMFDYRELFLEVMHTDDITKKRDNIIMQIFEDYTFLSIRKGDVYYSEQIETNLIDNNWHYISVSYDSINNILYGSFDTNIITINNPPGTWGAGSGNFIIFSENWASVNRIYSVDEAIICIDQFIAPQVFVDHYNHNVPWGAEYIP